MRRRPPRSTLFPYTPLFRSDRDWSSDVCSSDRSEEQTSELQSRSDLVCRLLLGNERHTGTHHIYRKTAFRNSRPIHSWSAPTFPPASRETSERHDSPASTRN